MRTQVHSRPKSLVNRVAILLGFLLVVFGAFTLSPALYPFLYLTLAVPVSETRHPPDAAGYIVTAKGDIVQVKGKLFIPAIKLMEDVIDSVETRDLDYGIGHYPDSYWPGMNGNAVLTGHNYYGRTPLFWLLHRVRKGDKVVIHYEAKRYEYKIVAKKIVTPEQIDKFRLEKANQLTLITCYPPDEATKRLVIIARESRRGRWLQ